MNMGTSKSVVVKAVFILFIYSLCLNLPYIHLREFQGEEGRRVNIAIDMLDTGEWIVPHHEGAIYLRKPPLFNWLLAGMFRLAGNVSETSARLVSVVTAFLCALVLSLFWKRMVLIRDAWYVLPGLIFLTFSDVIDKAIKAEIDMTFTFFITLSLVSWFYLSEIRHKTGLAWIVSLVLVSISVLTKGIQAPAFFYCGVIPYLFFKKDMKKIFSLSHACGIGLASGIFFLWFIPFAHKVGYSQIFQTWWGEIAVRKEPLREGGFLRHFIEFPFSYILAYLPWIPFMGLWKYRPLRENQSDMKNLAVFCLFCLLFSVPFYWVIPGARLRYLLPLSGMLSILLAIPINALLEGKLKEPRWQTTYIKTICVSVILVAVSSPFWGNRFKLFDSAVSIVLLGSILIAALLLIIEKHIPKKKMALLLITILLGKVLWASIYFPYHAQYHSHYRNAAQEINKMLSDDTVLYDYRVDNSHLTFYLKRPVQLVASLNEAMEEEGSFILMKKGDTGALHEEFSFIGEVKARRKIYMVFKYQASRKH